MSQPITTPLKSSRPRMTALKHVILVTLISLWMTLPTQADAESIPNLLTAPSTQDRQSPAASLDVVTDPTIIRQREVGLNFNSLPQTKRLPSATADTHHVTDHLLRLQLFDNVGYDVVLAQTTYSLDGTVTTWSGFINGMTDSQVIIVKYDEVVASNIATPDGKTYQIRYTGDGRHVVREIDLRAFPDAHPSADPPDKALTHSSPPLDDGDLIAPIGNTDRDATIDVMVVYTAAARSAIGGHSAVTTLIELAIAEANEGYANSNVTQRLRLVHQQEVSYTEPQSNAFTTSLLALTETSDGHLDEIHALRDQHGADLVSLIIDDRSFCGLGWQNNNPSPADAKWGFSVVMHACMAGNYTFAHELGHNMGANHDRRNASGSGMPYAFGYQEPSEEFRTIMAYNCDNWCPRINHWSNPKVAVRGKLTGVPHDDPDAADNHLVLENTYRTVAAWRTKPTQTPPTIEVTASGHQKDNGPERTLDGNLKTRWSVAIKPQSITYKLRQTTKVEKVEIAWFKGDERSAAFEIAVSRDNKNWNVAYRGRSGKRTTKLTTYRFNRRTARYVRILGYGNSGAQNFMWNSILEVVIRNDDNKKVKISNVTATSQQTNNPASHSIDGDLKTRWSAALTPAWILYDLGSARPIRDVNISWFKGGERTNSFDIAVSHDKQDWQEVYQGRSSGRSDHLETYPVGGANGRYVRIRGYGNSSQTSFMWNSVNEVEICHTGGCN